MPQPPGFDLLAISDRRAIPGGALEYWLGQVGAAGVGAVQIREKDLADRELLALAQSARSLLPPETLLLINGRVDIARAASSDRGDGSPPEARIGVHLPSTGVPIAALRSRFDPGLVVGRSTHTLAEIESARDQGADYATFGPVYPTPSKAAFGPPVGLAAFERAAALGLPLYALGGVTLERLPELARAGAAGIAGIRIFLDPAGLPALVAAARALFPPSPPPPRGPNLDR